MKTIKRTLAVMLTLLMLISAVPLGMMNVSAADEWVNSGNEQTVELVKAWPSGSSTTSGFCTSNALYTKYNKSVPSNTSTTRYIVTKEETIGYLYWHWCYSHDVGQPINCVIKGSKNQAIPKYDANGNPAGYYYTNNFHAFFSASKLNYVSSAYAFQHSNAKDCPYTYWWVSKAFNAQGNHNSHLEVVRTTYQKQVISPTTQSHIVMYNYLQNGGSSATKLVDAVEEGAAIDLTPTATKSGSTFVGWNTNASATTALTSLKMGTSDVTLYAIFKAIPTNVYNLGEETYSFENYGDNDSPGGHCFGMSATSSMYYLGLLNKSIIGGTNSTSLYSFRATSTVKAPICHYQSIQGSYALKATVAGGSYYKTNNSNIDSDWNQVINYVKDHSYDDKGLLQIGFRKSNQGGHAINFLRYKVVDGQERIYAYDNNFPDAEVYFYKDGNGKVRETPYSTFNGPIDCIALRNVRTYSNNVGGFDKTHVIYADKDTIVIEGAQEYPIDGSVETGEHVVFEIPDEKQEVKIIPLADNASFEYLDKEFSFGEISDDTYGVFTLLSMNDDSVAVEPTLRIVKNDSQPNDVCKWCGKTHEGFFQGIIGFFHRIFAALFGAKY